MKEVNSVNEKMQTLQQENGLQNDTRLAEAFSDIKSMLHKVTEFNNFYEQIKLQMLRRSELKKSFEGGVKEVLETQKNIVDMYNEIKDSMKADIDSLSQDVSNLEKENLKNNQKLIQVEKTKVSKEMQNNKVLNFNSKFEDESVDYFKDSLEEDCASRSSCGVCLEDPKCVWCEIQKRCTYGSLTGPADGSCNTSFHYGSCPDKNCSLYNNCFKCTEDTNCGWCGLSNTCVEGDRYNPAREKCERKYVHFNNSLRCNNLK